MDLFTPVIQEDKYHNHFKVLLSSSATPVRKILSFWAEGFLDRDNKFIKEFQNTFNSSFWELYLYQCFKTYGMDVDFSKSSPDFVIKLSNNSNINVEAVTANNALDDEPEWSSPEVYVASLKKPRNEILEYAAIRLLNAINSKHKKYLKNYGKLDHVKGHPFVLAIAPFEQPAFSRQNNQAINQVLFGCDAPQITGSSSQGGANFSNTNIETVTKQNGTSLDLGIFTSEKHKEISAVIFSTTATFSKALVQSDFKKYCTVISRRYKCGDGWFGYLDQISEKRVYKETHLDGLHVYYNPFAEHPLDIDIFNSYEVTNNFYNPETKAMESEHNDGSLVSRSVHWEFDK